MGKKKSSKRRAYNLKHRYGISEEDFDTMLNYQLGRCAICNSKKDLVVDHCHTSTKVRGLLCGHCNKGLGHFKDNIKFLSKAITYLTRNFDEGREA